MRSIDEEKMAVWQILNTAGEYFKSKNPPANAVEDRYPVLTYSDLCEIAGFPVSQRTLRMMTREGSIFFHNGGYSIAEFWDTERELHRG